MKLDAQIYYWAHMLDESLKEDNIGNTYLPKDENEKFKYSDIFTKELIDSLDTDKSMEDFLISIWPKWKEYFKDAIQDEIEFDGARTSDDDWDTWKITIQNLNGGYDKCESILFDNLTDDTFFDQNYIGSLKDMFDIIIEKLAEAESDFSTIEDYGYMSHKGR